MRYQDTKRHEWTLNEYCQVKIASPKMLHTMWFQLLAFLKSQNYQNSKKMTVASNSEELRGWTGEAQENFRAVRLF